MPAVIRKETDISAGSDGYPGSPPKTANEVEVYADNILVVVADPVDGQYEPQPSSPSPHNNPATRYATGGSPNVFIGGKEVHRNGDSISCGDTASNGSPDVFANS